jgi:hypothetical protein
MRRITGVGVVLLLAVLGLPSAAAGQQNGSERVKSRLEQSHANPLDPVSRIPFTLSEEDFEEGRPVVVTIRIRNVLGQFIASPAALDHPEGEVPVENLEYATPGLKEAVWNGLDRTGHRVTPGLYLLEMVINGERAPPLRIVVAN